MVTALWPIDREISFPKSRRRRVDQENPEKTLSICREPINFLNAFRVC